MALFLPGAFPGSNRGELLTLQACRVLVVRLAVCKRPREFVIG